MRGKYLQYCNNQHKTLKIFWCLVVVTSICSQFLSTLTYGAYCTVQSHPRQQRRIHRTHFRRRDFATNAIYKTYSNYLRFKNNSPLNLKAPKYPIAGTCTSRPHHAWHWTGQQSRVGPGFVLRAGRSPVSMPLLTILNQDQGALAT